MESKNETVNLLDWEQMLESLQLNESATNDTEFEDWENLLKFYEEIHRLQTISLALIWVVFTYVLLTNFLLVFGLLKTNKGQKLTNSKKLFISMSFIDICTMALSILERYFVRISTSRILLGLIIASSGICYVLACNIFVIISGLRYFALRYPFKRVSNKAIYLALLIALLLAICDGIISFMDATLPQTLLMIIVYISWWSVLAFGEMVLMTVVNILSFRYLKKCQREMNKADSKTSGIRSEDETMSKRNIKRKKYAIKI